MSVEESDLKLLVCEALLFTDDVGSGQFEIEEAGGIITLKGVVGSEEESLVAEAAVRKQPGVKTVINHLKISKRR